MAESYLEGAPIMRILLFAVFVCVWAAPAFANKDVDSLTTAGVAGTKWAVDCTKPASATNYYLIYGSTPAGTPTETLRTTSGNDKIRDIRNVQIVSGEWLLFTMHDSDGELINILTMRKGDRKKSWWSVGKDGKAYILNGKFDDKAEPPWFEKCE